MIIFPISHPNYMLLPLIKTVSLSLIETVQMRGHNIWFYAELTKKFPNHHQILSYLELCCVVENQRANVLRIKKMFFICIGKCLGY